MKNPVYNIPANILERCSAMVNFLLGEPENITSSLHHHYIIECAKNSGSLLSAVSSCVMTLSRGAGSEHWPARAVISWREWSRVDGSGELR